MKNPLSFSYDEKFFTEVKNYYLLFFKTFPPLFESQNLLKNISPSNKKEIKIFNSLLSYKKISHETMYKNKYICVLYLCIIKICFDFPFYQEFLNEKRLKHALYVLECIYHSKIREDLEDNIFQKISPDMFKKYSEILSITKKNVKTQEKYIQKTFQNLLKELDIKGKVYSRTKSIYSIHKKITKKNLILSQVLDRIGIRFILKTEEDCYKVMSQISCRYYLFKNKIKDYISIPKPNQYQSLHITILFQSFPVEIQIRTQKMHHCAEYGSADHAGYKLTS